MALTLCLRSVSQRVYTGPRSQPGRGGNRWFRLIPWAFVTLTIGLQIAWVLVPDSARVAVTAASVTAFFLASVTHAFVNRGLAWTLGFFVITLAFGWLIEVLGTTTQFPFGEYEYTSALGVSVLSVPILIPMAWSMVAYPMLLAVQRLSTTSLGVAIIGGWLLMSWDLFLDPQMVGEGYWTWTTVGWQLPGIPGIPLQNFLGWWLAGMLLMFLLDRLPRKTANDSAPNTLLLWTYASNVLGAAVFFDRPAVAIWGGVAMGIVIIPWAWRLWSQPKW